MGALIRESAQVIDFWCKRNVSTVEEEFVTGTES